MSSMMKSVLAGILISLLSTTQPVTQPIVTDSQTGFKQIARYVELKQRRDRVRSILDSVKTNLTDKEKSDLVNLIARESLDNGFSVEFVMAVMKTESAFNKFATSPVGAIGLMQLMPATGRALAADLGIALKDKRHLYNPQLNVTLGIRYLKQLTDRFQDMNLVLAAYNMGPNGFRRYKRNEGYPEFRYTRLVRKAHRTIAEM